MNYEELLSQTTKKLEDVRIRKAKVQEQISQLSQQLNLSKDTPIEAQLNTLEKDLNSKKEELEAKFKELEAKFTSLSDGTISD